MIRTTVVLLSCFHLISASNFNDEVCLMENFQLPTTLTMPGPDPSTVVKMRQDDREYLDPKKIKSLGLDRWNVVTITGSKEASNGELRVFFQPDEGTWKSAVQRPVSGWQQLITILGEDRNDWLDQDVWVKLYVYLSKTDIAEIAPYQREVDRHDYRQ